MKDMEKTKEGLKKGGKDMKLAIIVSLLKKKTGKDKEEKGRKCSECGKSPCVCED